MKLHISCISTVSNPPQAGQVLCAHLHRELVTQPHRQSARSQTLKSFTLLFTVLFNGLLFLHSRYSAPLVLRSSSLNSLSQHVALWFSPVFKLAFSPLNPRKIIHYNRLWMHSLYCFLLHVHPAQCYRFPQCVEANTVMYFL